LLLHQEEEDRDENGAGEGKAENTNPPATRSRQTDIYALGMTTLEIVSGKVPYSEYKNDVAIIRALDRKRPPMRPKELPCPNERADAIWTLLLQCWDHDPVSRPDALSVLISLQLLAIEATPNR